jgi:hypothetical protein
VSDDDRAVMERLAALEAEVKADADAQKARKDAALAKVREQRAAQLAEKNALLARQASIVKKKPLPAAAAPDDDDDDNGLGSALQLAKRANSVKQELEKKGAKSWVKSGIASTALGPIGWLYAGSFREAIPASVAWLALAALASKIIPSILLWPVLLVVMPLSGIAGVLYALGYNKKGSRQRLFDKPGDAKPKKALKSG